MARKNISYNQDIRVSQPLTKHKDIEVDVSRGLKREDVRINYDKPLAPLRANRRVSQR
jgi:hypothetical protein